MEDYMFKKFAGMLESFEKKNLFFLRRINHPKIMEQDIICFSTSAVKRGNSSTSGILIKLILITLTIIMYILSFAENEYRLPVKRHCSLAGAVSFEKV